MATGDPHPWQKLAPGTNGVPHRGHVEPGGAIGTAERKGTSPHYDMRLSAQR
jgi:hypothetical protein